MSTPDPTCQCEFVDTPYLSGVCGANFVLFMSLVEYLVKSHCDIVDPCRRPGVADPPDVAENNYDFIVVGAGVAGPVVTSRLSEVADWRVLLLEAGPNEPTLTSVPSLSTSAIGTSLDWRYKTEPSSLACLSSNGVCNWPRGKMVSGSSGMEGSMYTRPHPSILDQWGANNTGWSYNETLPYFIKSENNLNPELVEKSYHGFDGPLTVQQYPSRPAMADNVVQAGVQMGYRNGDLNGQNQTGVAVAQMMVYQGMRASTARMYLRPYTGTRENLKVGINSHVTKVLINHSTKKAYGVEYLDKDGIKQVAYAHKEVILSAGAVNSPQLLLLSGVGPSEDLVPLDIDVVVNLPGVGKNLQNHVATSIGFYIDEAASDSLTLEAVREFTANRTGNLTSTGLTQTTLFMKSKYAQPDVPDLQVFFNGYTASCSRTGAAEECEVTGALENCGKRYIAARPTNVLPLSRGYLTLRSSNPLDPPLIYPRYLQAQRDVDVLVDGLKLAIQLTKQPALQKYGFTMDTTPVAGCDSYTFASDEYFSCAIRMKTGPENHQAGSCKMGPASDVNAVVDNELRVHGVSNIRVVDASFFPINPNSNPTSVIVMAAEKASDLIKAAWEGTA
ncbi:glucose dehydrogenase [FAD, quinone]-like [Periplaneta americana]|uniref:glucose dehydrogenase [FAD, quinone]-like n=1 Tax=Periplaneta americana TaxID=6978 RepID=UPI0037E93E91